MSRSLDAETTASIQAAPSYSSHIHAVYDDLVRALDRPDKTSLFEIEMLGKSHALPAGTHVLTDGASIAVPKSTLVQAFLVARKILFESPLLDELDTREHDQTQYDRHRNIRNAAAVMLLMDPEHVTAANARKRVVRMYADASEQRETLAQERWWLDGMLTSRLHRHTKSPTLWGHRRWLLEECERAGLGAEYDIHEDLRAVVLVAAEMHFCNYYAWMHLRWLLARGRGEQGGEGIIMVWEERARVLDAVKVWCLRHPADTAGFSFMLFCLQEQAGEKDREGESGNECNTREVYLLDARSAVCKEVLDRAVSFRWTNEAVWVFLRTLVAFGVAGEQRAAFFESIEVLREVRAENPKSLATLQAAHDWVLKYERKMSG